MLPLLLFCVIHSPALLTLQIMAPPGTLADVRVRRIARCLLATIGLLAILIPFLFSTVTTRGRCQEIADGAASAGRAAAAYVECAKAWQAAGLSTFPLYIMKQDQIFVTFTSRMRKEYSVLAGPI